MKRVVSVSIGTASRDKRSLVDFQGERFELSREGTDGDLGRFAARMRELDGEAAALGIGGADRYLVVGDRRYPMREIDALVRDIRTPVVDGSGLKHTLERRAIQQLQADGVVDFARSRTLLVSAVDRFGMAQALHEAGGRVTYGDLIFGLGIPVPIRSYAAVRRLGRLLLPIITRLPFRWLYPTGDKQLQRQPRAARLFVEADVIAGDWHYIRRYAPDNLTGKTVLTQTLRSADFEFLRAWGVRQVITTTPRIDGETFATNVLEALIAGHLGRIPTTPEIDEVLRTEGWQPSITNLSDGVR